MPNFIPDETYSRLLADLSAAFIIAATNTGTNLYDELAKALATANVLPEVCRDDFEVVERLAA